MKKIEIIKELGKPKIYEMMDDAPDFSKIFPAKFSKGIDGQYILMIINDLSEDTERGGRGTVIDGRVMASRIINWQYQYNNLVFITLLAII
jgi:hypothetical protein